MNKADFKQKTELKRLCVIAPVKKGTTMERESNGELEMEEGRNAGHILRRFFLV